MFYLVVVAAVVLGVSSRELLLSHIANRSIGRVPSPSGGQFHIRQRLAVGGGQASRRGRCRRCLFDGKGCRFCAGIVACTGDGHGRRARIGVIRIGKRIIGVLSKRCIVPRYAYRGGNRRTSINMIAAHRHNSIVQISRYRKLGADDFRSQYHAAAKISGDGVFSDFEAFLFRQGDRQFGRIVDDVRSSQFRTGILRSKVKVHLALIRTGVGSWGLRDLSGQGDLGAVSRTGRADGNRRIFWIGYSYIAFYRSRAA